MINTTHSDIRNYPSMICGSAGTISLSDLKFPGMLSGVQKLEINGTTPFFLK